MSHAYYNIRRAFLALVLLLTVSISQSFAQWVQMPALPTVRNLSAQTVLDGKLYIFGGTAADFSVSSIVPNGASVATGAMLSLPNGPSWTAVLPMPTPRNGAYAASINNKIYIVGGNYVQGTSVNLTPSVLEFDPSNQSYTEKESMPTPVIGPAYAHIGTKIYVMGGFSISGSNVQINDIIQEYDVATGAWTTLTVRLPYPMAYGTATAIGQKIMLVGGASVQNNSLVYTRNAYMGTTTPGGITWNKVADYPTFVSQAASGTLSGKAYVAGGVNGTGALAISYRFDEAGNKWESWYQLPAGVSNIQNMPGDGTSIYLASGGSKNVFRLSEGTPVSVAAIGQTDVYVTSVAATEARPVAIRIGNIGVAPLEGTVVVPVEAQSWLTTSTQIYGPAPGGGSANLGFLVGGPSVAVGNYKTTVAVTTNDPNKPSIPVTIRLFVRETLQSQPTRVVMEESSGNWCPPCGAYGVPTIRAMEEEHGEDLIVVAYHDRGGRQLIEPMQTAETEDIGRKLGVQQIGWPSAAIQRLRFPGQPFLVLGSGDWADAASTLLAAQPNAPVAMELKEYKYDLLSNKITAKLEFTTTQAMPWSTNSTLRVTAVVTEDSLEYSQEGTDEDPFFHMHAARDFWPNTSGKEVEIPATALHEDGTVLLPNQTFTVDVDFTPEHLENAKRSHIVFMVHMNQGTALGPIFQGLEHKTNENIGVGGGITFDAGTTTKSSGVGTEITFESTINNAGSSPIQITAMRTGTQYPEPNWSTRICVVDDCGTASEDSKSGTVAPGSSKTFKIRVTPGSVGTGKVTMRFADGNGYEVTQEYTLNAQASGVDRETVASNGLRLMQNTPNPAATITRFGYTLPKASDVIVDVFSITGEKMFSVAEGTFDAGDRTFDLNVSSLPNGIYTVRLTANGTSVSRTITVAR